MSSTRLGRAFRSIHIRLLLVMILSGIIIQVVLLVALSAHRRVLSDAFRHSVAQYVQYLARDLGSPPDFNRAVELAEHTGMTIHYFSPEATWSTSGEPLAAPMERIRTWPTARPVQIGMFHGHHYLIYRLDPERAFFFEILAGPAKDRRLVWAGPLLLLLVALVLIGSYLWIRRIMAPLRPLTHGVRQVGAGLLDHRVTVRRHDELGELALAFNGMAERLQALIRSKDRMLLDVSHELRSPLTRMKIALEMAPDGALKQSLAEDIVEMEQMVTTILASARAQSGNFPLEREEVDLAALIYETISHFADRPPGIRLEAPSEPVASLLDPGKVKTVLRNIIENALKYSKETSGPVAVRPLAAPDATTIEIRDEGIGICAQDLPFVFEPFYRVDPSRSRETGGFGLGLSLCKAIMELHGGSIAMESILGEGTTVRLRFPRQANQKDSLSPEGA